jgi:hypothetical protein
MKRSRLTDEQISFALRQAESGTEHVRSAKGRSHNSVGEAD